MTAHVPAADLCSEAQGLVDIDTACTRAATYAATIAATEVVAVHRAGGRTLAENVSAELAMPAFDQSAMDGYAIALGGAMLPAGTRLPVVGRVAAGDAAVALLVGHAARVFTGAPLPSGADAVLMQGTAGVTAMNSSPTGWFGQGTTSGGGERTSNPANTFSRRACASMRVTSRCFRPKVSQSWPCVVGPASG
jgi:hypothetical protein